MKKIIIATAVIFTTGLFCLPAKYNNIHVSHSTIKVTVFGNTKELGSGD